MECKFLYIFSALVVRFLTGRFIWEYDPTLEAAYRHHTMVDDEVAVMDILDTAGQVNGWEHRICLDKSRGREKEVTKNGCFIGLGYRKLTKIKI